MELQIRNAFANNLKGISLSIPHHKLVVITGVSGSGKSSLAYDVIANAGQNAFLENIPSFARKFGAKKVELKAEVDHLFPVVAVKQNPGTPNVTSTLGTISDVYDLFRVLFSRYGSAPNDVTLTRSHFSFNTKEGACEKCRGIGNEEYISVAKLIADENKSLREGALIPTQPNGYTMYSQVTVDAMNEVCEAHGFSVDIPWKELTDEQKEVVLNGSERVKIPFGKHSEASRLNWTGIKAKPREKGFYKGMLPIMEDILKRDRNKNILKFVDARTCGECHGERLGKLARVTKWHSFSITELTSYKLEKLVVELNQITADSAGEASVIHRITETIEELISLGFQKHSLNFPANRLAQGEIQRIRLVNQLRSGLSNILYVFDEPGAGLHPAYQQALIKKFQDLVAKGNSVILVEHGKLFIEQADWIVEIGPAAGVNGGEVLHNCSLDAFIALAENSEEPSPTQLCFRERIPLERSEMTTPSFPVEMNGVRLMSSRINVIAADTSAPKLQEIVNGIQTSDNGFVHVNRKPIGKTPRSNPATYTGLADELRNEFAKLPEAKSRGLKKSHFSFNTKGGRCETCEGAGKTVIGMSYLGKIEVTCDTCEGKRFKDPVLQVKLEGKSIADIYELSVNEANEALSSFPKITSYLKQLVAVGLGYLKLGQSSSTLSGGEAQRLKLASRLFGKESSWLFLEEPTSGLNEQDLGAVLHALDQLCLAGNTIVAVDYNQRMIEEAHHVIELSYEGVVLYQGEGSELSTSEDSQLGTAVLEPMEGKQASSHEQCPISLVGCKTHHLKTLDIEFKPKAITVVTGRSGSGKSSLVAHTLHDLSTSLYLSGLSAYQRSFISNANQADVAAFSGLTPTVFVAKRTQIFSDWAIVGTTIGVFEEIRFLYSRAAQLEGKTIPASEFNFTSIKGACEKCGGKGSIRKSTAQTLIADWSLSPLDGAFAWSKTLAYYGAPDSRFFSLLKAASHKHSIDLSIPMNQMGDAQLEIILNGTGEEVYEVTWEFENKTRKGSETVKGSWDGFASLIEQEYLLRKDNKNITGITELLEVTQCDLCLGKRLSNRLLGVSFASLTLGDLLSCSIQQLASWLRSPKSNPVEEKLLAQFKEGITRKLSILEELGLGYLTLGRSMNSLSGGESQRVRLVQLLAQPLTGLTVIMDEPSSGLDENLLPKLQTTIQRIREKGNTVILVEHNASMISFADEEIQLGPGAGENGGQIIYQGVPREIDTTVQPEAPINREKKANSIQFYAASKWSLNNEDFTIQLRQVNHITGISGAGKSTLLEEVILPSLITGRPVNCASFNGESQFKAIHFLQQMHPKNRGGKSVVDYLGVLEGLTRRYTREAKKLGVELKAAHFDYRKKEGRCTQCSGSGMNTTSLDMLDEVWSVCEKCQGKRYNEASLQVKVDKMSIGDVLNGSLKELNLFAKNQIKKSDLLEICIQLGLSHLKANQSVNSLSAGEFQRLRLAKVLEQNASNELIALDEVSNGLHQDDLRDVLNYLTNAVNRGNTFLIIDHHPMVHQWSNHKIKLSEPSRSY